jgi:hypothetical protein
MADALPLDQIRHLWRPGRPINRRFTWAVLYRDGKIATEDAYASLTLVPRDLTNPITVLAVVAVDDPSDTSRHYRLHVPEGAEPFNFWRTTHSAGVNSKGAITCLGYRTPNGAAAYLWVYDDGRVVVTDRDLYDLT